MDNKPYIRALEINAGTNTFYEKGNAITFKTGFTGLNEYYTVKPGCTTYIGGIPSHGKTEFHMELLLHLSEYYGWKHFLFTPETGSPVEIVAELSHKYIMKPFHKVAGQMSLNEKYQADAWLNEYFFIHNSYEETTIDDLLKLALEVKDSYGLNTLSIDPWNELAHDFAKHAGREDKYLEFVLGKIRRFARDNNIHIFIIAHPRTLRPVDGRYEPPTAFELSGGAAWYAKAETIICVFRPSMDNNEADIIIQKAKPKHIGKKGQCKLYFDYGKSRYYELVAGQRQFATKPQTEVKQKPLEPNEQFILQSGDDLPF